VIVVKLPKLPTLRSVWLELTPIMVVIAALISE
jgi:hypothetical protein